MNKSYIWSLPTRIFHIFFAILILLAYFINDNEYINFHALFGYTLIVLLFFRVYFGFFGVQYSRFNDFPISMKNIKKFLKNIFNQEQEYIGHNPIASLVMLSIFFTTFLSIISGMVAFGVQEAQGLFSFLNSSFYKNMDFFKDIHEVCADILMALVVLHLTGVLADRFLHKQYETLSSIFTGFKVVKNENGISLTLSQKIISTIFILFAILFFFYNLNFKNNILYESKFKPINYEREHPLFVEECASCHMLYPPYLLGNGSWLTMMENLENHFGDDASIPLKNNLSILTFLEKNSANASTRKVSQKVLKYDDKKEIIAFSETLTWKKAHKDVKKSEFEKENVKTKANCVACHKKIEKGII